MASQPNELRRRSLIRAHRLWRPTGLAGVVLPALLAVAGCASAPPQETGQLAAYAASPAFLSVQTMHAEAATDPDQRALLMTWFVDGDPNVAQYCSVLPDGHVSSYRLFYDSALQNGLKRDLAGDQLSQLKQTMDSLPPSQSPAVRNMLIVSFRDYASGNWVTRTYDRFNRPPAVSALFAVTGADRSD